MKNGKRPTRRQKEAIQWAGKDPDKWLVSKTIPDTGEIIIVHRETGKQERIPAAM